MQLHGLGTLVLTLGCFAASAVHAGSVYMFKDKQGNVLLTNVVDTNQKPTGKSFSSYSTKVKVTTYPDSNIHEYSNWGKSSSSVLPAFSKNKNSFDHLIHNAASRYGIDAGLMKAIMHTESSFNPNAKSPVGAQGLMQLMPATAKRFGVQNAWNPEQNIEGSAKYLKYLTKRFKGNLQHVLAGYNAGEGNVDKYGGIPPFKETQNYVVKVMERYTSLYSGMSSSASITPVGYQVISPRPGAKNQLITKTLDWGSSDQYSQSAFKAIR